MTFSGLDENGNTNTAVEIYTVGSGWSQQYFAGWTPPLYPRMHLLPNGKVFYSGSGHNFGAVQPANTTWTTNVATHSLQRAAILRNLGAAAPDAGQQLRPESDDHGREQSGHRHHRNHRPGCYAAKWKSGPSMSQARIEMNAVILPNWQGPGRWAVRSMTRIPAVLA